MNPDEPQASKVDWLNFADAQRHTGRSESTLKRAVDKGFISKRLLSIPGQRPQAQLYVPDLDRHFSLEVHSPTSMDPGEPLTVHEPREPRTRELTRTPVSAPMITQAKDGNLPAAVFRLAEIIQRPQVELRDKLTWTPKEAALVSGLSRLALKELMVEHPDAVIRRGRRVRFRAGKLRDLLA